MTSDSKEGDVISLTFGCTGTLRSDGRYERE